MNKDAPRGVPAFALETSAVMGRAERSHQQPRIDSLSDLAHLLLDPSRAKHIPADSTALRLLEAASLALNLAAFYLIVMLNKKLLKDPAKGGYVCTICVIARPLTNPEAHLSRCDCLRASLHLVHRISPSAYMCASPTAYLSDVLCMFCDGDAWTGAQGRCNVELLALLCTVLYLMAQWYQTKTFRQKTVEAAPRSYPHHSRLAACLQPLFGFKLCLDVPAIQATTDASPRHSRGCYGLPFPVIRAKHANAWRVRRGGLGGDWSVDRDTGARGRVEELWHHVGTCRGWSSIVIQALVRKYCKKWNDPSTAAAEYHPLQHPASHAVCRRI